MGSNYHICSYVLSSAASCRPCWLSSSALSSFRWCSPSYRSATTSCCCQSPWGWLAPPWGSQTPSPTCSWSSCTRRTLLSSCRLEMRSCLGRKPRMMNGEMWLSQFWSMILIRLHGLAVAPFSQVLCCVHTKRDLSNKCSSATFVFVNPTLQVGVGGTTVKRFDVERSGLFR